VTDWLQLAKDSFESSTNYLDANLRKAFERNIALFQSKHPNASKYNSPAYKSRSRLFRPKTKSVVRKNEAAASAAFFANVDVISVEAENDGDPAQLASAELMNEILNYRLTKTIPWYVTLIGAVQEAQVIGIVGSYQYWRYKEKPTKVRRVIQDDLGNVLSEDVVDGPPDVIEDKPCVELMPVENYRFDPSSDWTDVVGSSPYFIRMVPMYVDDVRQRMADVDPKTGHQKWKKLEDGEIRTAMVEYDTIRQAREAPKQDPKAEQAPPLSEFEIVWCHENFVRLGGNEVVYWTLGTQHLLSDPVPLKQAYFHGVRPFTIGCAVIEAHKAIPESLVAIGSELQKEVNETVNQRRDNVSLVLNKRYKVRRNAQVDIPALIRNVPGGSILMNDPESDVIEMPTIDVTGSSYQEQDRLNVDFDELTGNFSQGSVQTNRKLNETVGGMQLMDSSANQMTEYLLRTIVETWVEKTLHQLVQLEQHYETDDVVLGLAGQRAQLAQKYGIDQITDDLLNKSLTVRVNVGMGATDPQKKLGRFLSALKAYGEAMAAIPDGNPEAIRNEVFGLAGYKNGNRFFGGNPANQKMQAQMQDMQKQIQEMGQKLQLAQIQLANKAGELKIQAYDADTKRMQATDREGPEDTSVDDMKTVADAHLKLAQIDLTQAQTAATLVDAALAPSVALMKQATDAE